MRLLHKTGQIGGWNIVGNNLSSGDFILDADNDKVSISDGSLQIKPGSLSSTSTGTLTITIPSVSISPALVFGTTPDKNIGLTTNNITNSNFTVSTAGTYTYSWPLGTEYDYTNFIQTVSGSPSGYFNFSLRAKITEGSGTGGTVVGYITLGAGQAIGGFSNITMNTSTVTQSLTFGITGTHNVEIQLQVSNYLSSGEVQTATGYSETSHSWVGAKTNQFTEVTNQGVQVVRNSTDYVKMTTAGSTGFYCKALANN